MTSARSVLMTHRLIDNIQLSLHRIITNFLERFSMGTTNVNSNTGLDIKYRHTGRYCMCSGGILSVRGRTSLCEDAKERGSRLFFFAPSRIEHRARFSSRPLRDGPLFLSFFFFSACKVHDLETTVQLF